MSVRAWTLGYGPAYEKAVRMEGNAKAPGGYAFRTADDAFDYVLEHALNGYQPYEMVLPGPFEECTTRSLQVAAFARHAWHMAEQPGRAFMVECGVCFPPPTFRRLDFDVLTVVAPFINPDTGRPA